MELLTFAHRAEAQCFFDEFGLSQDKAQENIFLDDHRIVAILGEGIEASIFNTTRVMQRFPNIQKVLNFGVVGALPHPSPLNLGQLISVNTVYGESAAKDFQFKSFSSSHSTSSIDCITAAHRVLNEDYASRLAPIAPMVDRELWGIAYVCHQMKLPWESFKVVSDFAGKSTLCFEVQAHAPQFSKQLFDAYLTSKNSNPTPNKISEIKKPWDNFYVTKSQGDKLEKLHLQFIKLFDEKKWTNFLEHPLVVDISNHKNFHPKQKTQKFLDVLTTYLDPSMARLIEKTHGLKQTYKKSDIDLKFDPQGDSEQFKVSFNVISEQDLNRKISQISQLPISDIQKWYEGE